ncbi:hypothetical protein Clacol_000891 [Clathrus columnatus]|uniref:Uncharacterized protein n=1 Tax=Clathrus columnatus TaxID=1419009 RepID=A0AAV5A2A7_9AGAM|nr:hypothetical protein Clacol_000891 [Clathrus columnatus]
MYKRAIYTMVKQTLENKLFSITADLGETPQRFDLTSDLHTSRSDPTPHYLVDAYAKDSAGEDLPLGTVHVYDDGEVTSFARPRAIVMAANLPTANWEIIT